MLVRNNRLSRALAFKQKVEEDGRHLDVISYGTLIEHYGNHGKLGSAMLVLKECLQVHGAPPGSKSLAKLRLLCRQNDMESKLRQIQWNGSVTAKPTSNVKCRSKEEGTLTLPEIEWFKHNFQYTALMLLTCTWGHSIKALSWKAVVNQ